tara:strand:+ start:1285 stop:1689 length:405 start_codon:yes stop_codon:yes gene_type:complete
MNLIYINELGPNFRGENMYEFIFSTNTEELWGEDWDAVPAYGKPAPPDMEYISVVGTLAKSKIKLILVQNSEYFGMEHAMDNVICLGWESFDEDHNTDKERLVFHFGETKKEIEDKLYSRDLILDYDKTLSYVK